MVQIIGPRRGGTGNNQIPPDDHLLVSSGGKYEPRSIVEVVQQGNTELGELQLGETSETAYRGDRGAEMYAIRHTHSNKSILDSIQEALTTALKTAYDAASTWVTTNGSNVLSHLSRTDNPHAVTKGQVGLGNADNTSDVNKPISTATQTALDGKANTSHTHSASQITDFTAAADARVSTGIASHVAETNPHSQYALSATLGPVALSNDYNDLNNKPDLSIYDNFDDYADLASFPVTGATGVIYLARDSGFLYRWNGSGYSQMSAQIALGETSDTAYRGDRGKTAYDHSQITTGNPHGTSKADVGLGNVPNLDTTTAVGQTHTHSNKSVLDAIQEALTTALKVAYDAASSWVSTNGTNVVTHLTRTDNPHAVTKGQVGLGNVDNTSDVNKPVSTAQQTALDAKISVAQKGAVNGVAELDGAGKVPASQLPSFVDDVIEVANFAALPVTGEEGKIYITLDANLTYRWSGTAYVEISASLALGETSSTAYRGDRGKIAYDYSQIGHIPAFADPNADRLVFWDDSANAFAALTASTGLTLSGTNLTVRSASQTVTGISEQATDAETVTGTDTSRHITPANLTARLAAPGAIGGTTPGAITGTTITANTHVNLPAQTASTVAILDASKNVVSSPVTSAALAVLDGITATTAELNFVDGVTSNVQTQLDSKVTGPASSVDNNVPRFNGTTGKLLEGGSITNLDNGNVGIGTTTPTQTLSVAGTVNITGQTLFGSDTAVTYSTNHSPNVQINGTTGIRFGMSRWTNDVIGNIVKIGKSRGAAVGTNASVTNSDSIASFDFDGDGGSGFLRAASISALVDTTGTVSGTSMPGRLEFRTTPDGSNGPSTRLSIISNGNVGIGTLSPNSILSVVQTSAGTTTNVLQIGNLSTADNTGARINFNLSPAENFFPAYIEAVRTNSGGGGRTYLAFGAGSGTTEHMRINETGNIGIGTSSPTALLDVNSDLIRVRTARTPASASAAGNQGNIAWDADYIYVCVATNTWKRSAIATW